jgi:hypothetical protein
MKNIIRVLMFGIVILTLSGCGGMGGVTKEEWLAKLKENKLDKKIGYHAQFGTGGYCAKEEFIKIMGQPDKTQKVGGETYWYYTCSDGQIQMIVASGNLEPAYGGNVVLASSDGINEY